MLLIQPDMPYVPGLRNRFDGIEPVPVAMDHPWPGLSQIRVKVDESMFKLKGLFE
jgi:hypothetical protein